MRKPFFCICENKDAVTSACQEDERHFCVFGTLLTFPRIFVFATRIVQSLYYLNQKFQASSHLMWLYSPICVGPGRKPRGPVSHNEAQLIHDKTLQPFNYNYHALTPFSPRKSWKIMRDTLFSMQNRLDPLIQSVKCERSE